MYSTIFNTHDVILLMTVYQCSLFALLLFTIKGDKRVSNILLALFLLQQAAIPLDILISFGAEFRNVALEISPNLFYVFGFGYWLEAPLLLWYTRSLIYKDYALAPKDFLLFLPFGIYLMYQIFFYYGLDYSDKQNLQEGYELTAAPSYMNSVTLLRELYRCALGFLCLYELRKYHRHLKNKFSSTEKHEIWWLNLLVWGFTLLRSWSVLVLVLIIISINYGITTNFETMGLIGNYTAFVLVSLLIFFSLAHSSVYEGVNKNDANLKGKFEEECLDPKQAIFVREWMNVNKPYLTPSLTLDKLSQMIDVPSRTLSQIINRQFNCNFFEFVNIYRIEEAKVILLNPENKHKSVIDVMYDAGFNSKATFNTLFKKKVGTTPSKFRSSHAK